MKTLGLMLLVPLALVAASPLDEEGKVTVTGRLVDASGQPLTGATVGTDWNLKSDPPSTYQGMLSNADGVFRGEIQAWRYPVGLGAFSADGSLAGYAMVEEDGVGSIEITLKPSVKVSAQITCEGLGRTPAWANVMFSMGDYRIGSADTKDGDVQATLPQGEVSWSVYDSYFSSAKGTRELGAEALEVDLGSLDVPAAFLAVNEGKLLPEWTVSAARNVPLDQASLAAHRGKWLLIEFWGFW